MYLGIDLGGTKIEAVVLTTTEGDQFGDILYRKRVNTPMKDYEATLRAIKTLIDQADNDYGPFYAVGVGTPGAVSTKTGAMKNCNSTCLNGQYLLNDLEQITGKRVVQANDANCFALSEAIDGSAAGDRVVFGVILGTGVGGGVVINGEVLQGVNRIAGEWGHNPMPLSMLPEGEMRACYCGKINCVETYLSGHGFAQTYQTLIGAHRGLVANPMAHDIALLIDRKDKQALCALDIYSKQLAAALSEVINILDPDTIVLGGGMSNIEELYSRVLRWLPEFVFSDSVETKVRPPTYGDSSGVRGAAWLVRGEV